MDELLHARVEQLKAIDDLLERLEKAITAGQTINRREIQVVRHFVMDAIAPAERAAYLARDYERLQAANAGLVKDLKTIERERTDWKLCTDGNVERLQSMIRAALARHAATNLAAPPLVWSDAKPTVPGWYWRRDDINQEPCIGYYDPKNWFGTEWMRDLPGQFAGPIPPPAPTPTEDAPR